MDAEEDGQDPIAVLRRWEDFGAVWEVVQRTTTGQAVVSLRRCDGGEEVSRLVSDDPRLLAYLDERDAADSGGDRAPE